MPHYVAELANEVSKYAEVTLIKPEITTADNLFHRNVEIINAFKELILSFVDFYDLKRALKVFTLTNILKILSYRNIDVVKKINPDAKIIAVSGYAPNGKTHDATNKGAQEFVSKPYQLGEISRKIRNILDS